MYMVTPGNYTETQPVARRPMERVAFANTDSEGPVSSTATGITAARRAVREIQIHARREQCAPCGRNRLSHALQRTSARE